MTTWAIIPAHNEGKNLWKVVRNTKKFVRNIIIVDDGSSDGTSSIVDHHGAILIRHSVNLGKGAAVKTGCDYAIKQGATRLIILDSDGQHKPEDIPRFLEKLGKYDIVFSCRKSSKEMPSVLKFGNKVISLIANLLYGINLSDTQCGFRAFTSEAYRKIRWTASDYSMESEMIARTGKHKLKYVHIPIQTIYADKYKGTTVLDGVKIVIYMILWKIFSNLNDGQ